MGTGIMRQREASTTGFSKPELNAVRFNFASNSPAGGTTQLRGVSVPAGATLAGAPSGGNAVPRSASSSGFDSGRGVQRPTDVGEGEDPLMAMLNSQMGSLSHLRNRMNVRVRDVSRT